MTQFSLFEKLLTPKVEVVSSEKSATSRGICYQQYDLEVEGKTININIPIRESQTFENEVTNLSEPLTFVSLKLLLRKYRGTR